MGYHVAYQFGPYRIPKRNHFLDYSEHCYWKNFPNSRCIEESLAQAFKFSLRSRVPGFREALTIATDGMPDCYREWKRFSGESFQTGVHQLVQDIHEQYVLQGHDIKKCTGAEAWRAMGWSTVVAGAAERFFFPLPTEGKMLREEFASVPRYILRGGYPRARYPFIQPYSYANKKLKKFNRHLERNYGVRIEKGKRRGHPIYVTPSGQRIPYTDSKRDFVPDYLARTLAEALKVPEAELMAF